MIDKEFVFSPEFLKFLKKTGFNDFCKSEQDLDKRLYHDLGIDEDIAEEILELLKSEFDVEISQFNISAFFPPEFQGKNQFQRICFWILPFLEKYYFDKDKYEPFTFRMIEKAISHGKLTSKD